MEVPRIWQPAGQSADVDRPYGRYVCCSWVERRYELTSTRFAAGYYSCQQPPGFGQMPCPARPVPLPRAGPVGPIASPHRHGASTNKQGSQIGGVKLASAPKHGRQFERIAKGAAPSESTRRMKESPPTTLPVQGDGKNSCSLQNGQSKNREKTVHWVLTAKCDTRMPVRGVLKPSRRDPLYHQILLTPPFTLHVKFQSVQISIAYTPVKFLAKRLLDFEQTLRTKFPEECQTHLEKALDKGYCLIVFTRGFKKRVPVYVRGPRSVHPEAAFTGFLNTVRDHASVLLEWE
jgi:hypothetical protein